MVSNSKVITRAHCTVYSVDVMAVHAGYRNLARIANKHKNMNLWFKYHCLSMQEMRKTTHILKSLNHSRLKRISASEFRTEFAWYKIMVP